MSENINGHNFLSCRLKIESKMFNMQKKIFTPLVLPKTLIWKKQKLYAEERS